jgi:hypothetical protein
MEYSNYEKVNIAANKISSKTERLSFLLEQLSLWERNKPTWKQDPICNFENVYDRTIRLIKCDINTLELTLKYTTKQQSISSQQLKTTTGNQPPHFNGDYTDEELTATFEKLKNGKYIHSESDLDSWIYLCTGREEKAFTEPINWTKSGVLLGMFVQDLFSITDNTAIWEITAKCFTVKGKTPNTNSIKVSLSKIKQNWKNGPKDYDKMKNEIINDII